MNRYQHAGLAAAIAGSLVGLVVPAAAQTTGSISIGPGISTPNNNSGISTPNNNSGISTPGSTTSTSAENGITTTTTTNADGTTTRSVASGSNVVVVPGPYPSTGPTVIRGQGGGVSSTPTGALNGGVPTGALDGGVPGASGAANTSVRGGSVPAAGAAGGAAR